MKLFIAPFACATLCFTQALGAQGESKSPAPILGFTQESATRQRALEAVFDSHLKAENLRQWMKKMTEKPHHVGSPFGKEVADFIAAQFRSWGFETSVERFDVLFPTPSTRVVEMTAPVKFTALLDEPALKEDSTSNVRENQLPTYNAYSIDGDVTGPLVYVNYGAPKDYEVLAERGIDVQGKIVLARYGGTWRGIKPKVAAEHGAIGCLIYSDPKDDGYFEGDVYPKGAWRNEHGAQRGSVADIPLFPGDPLTPGIAATPGAKRLSLRESPTLTKIPVLPISYGDALPLLRALQNGPVAPEEWRGALPITYHLGPGPATIHLHLAFDWKTVPAYNVIAKMNGAERADEWVIRGNHHDAWVLGADDPISGTVALMEEARALSELAKNGWRPKRTVIFAAWDAEEPGLIGSTEWVEAHAESLKQKVAVYVNGDNNGRGFLRVGGSHTLEKFINEVARDVIDPQKNIPVSDRLRAYRIVKGTGEDAREARDRADFRIGALGSGSDYTPFLQHLGIASMDIRYGGEDQGGSYHSVYDSYDHYTRFGDPDFRYGVTLAQTTGRVVLRLANADVLPFEFANFHDTAAKYVKELQKLTDDLRESTRERNRRISDHTLEAVADPAQPFVLPKMERAVPYLNFAPLDNALARLRDSARNYEDVAKRLRSGELSNETQKAIEAITLQAERFLTNDAGLPRRPWYKHLIYAPGFYTGYGVKTFPGVREAIEQRNWAEASEQIDIAGWALVRFSEEIERAAALAKRQANQ